MAAIAVWMTCFLNRRQNARLEARIQALLPLVHELVIDDPAKIAVVKLEEYWYDENRWEVYLPPAITGSAWQPEGSTIRASPPR